jgi:uncharacterized membrane protein
MIVSDIAAQPTSSLNVQITASTNERSLTNGMYICYILGFFFPLAALAGVILAYINRGKDVPPYIRSHFDYGIRTFWWGLAMVVAGIVLSLILVGYLILLAYAVWTIIRIVKGMSALSAGTAI